MIIVIQKLCQALQNGQTYDVKNLINDAISENIPTDTILNDGLLKGMDIIGVKFKTNDIYIPEVLIAAKAFKAGIDILRPKLVSNNIKPIGKIIIGTIKGDIHDIGKNLVALMMESVGIEVIDLGINVDSNTFIENAEKHNAQIIAISSLLTTTMINIKDIIDNLNSKNIRKKYIIMVGGSPLTSQFAKEIKADVYTPDAITAAEVAKNILLSKGGYYDRKRKNNKITK